MNKVEYHIIYNPKIYEDMGNIVAQLDLGINRIECPGSDYITIATKTKVTKNYIKAMSDEIKKFYESEGNRVLSIEGREK